MLARAQTGRRCVVCYGLIHKGEHAYWCEVPAGSNVWQLRCTRCGEWPSEVDAISAADPELIAVNRQRAAELAASIASRPGYVPPERQTYQWTRARNLRIGDVAEHPDSCQLGQVAELHARPEAIEVLLIDRCRWTLDPGTVLKVHHRVVEVSS